MDTDQEIEGIAVIADFQGAPLDDDNVLAEYKEIRDAVLADVSRVGHIVLTLAAGSGRQIIQSSVEKISWQGDDCYEQSNVRSTCTYCVLMLKLIFAQNGINGEITSDWSWSITDVVASHILLCS